MKQKIEQNIAALQQGALLLETLDDAVYQAKVPEVFGSTLGAHIRHNLDHYLSFLACYESGELDYEARKRDPLLETSRRRAIEVIEEIVQRLGELSARRGASRVRIRLEGMDGFASDESWASSSIERELEFLLSHTIHHYALVAVMCRFLGHGTDPDFGVAPSTLRFRALQSPCAR